MFDGRGAIERSLDRLMSTDRPSSTEAKTEAWGRSAGEPPQHTHKGEAQSNSGTTNNDKDRKKQRILS